MVAIATTAHVLSTTVIPVLPMVVPVLCLLPIAAPSEVDAAVDPSVAVVAPSEAVVAVRLLADVRLEEENNKVKTKRIIVL